MLRRKHVKLHPNLIQSEALASDASISCYKQDILKHYCSLQRDISKLLNPVMIDNQPEIKWSMRPYLIDFLIELHIFFDLSPEALYIASTIADRYCSKRIVYKRHYQLLVATSLWIAAKYQDKKSKVPTLKELYLLCYQIYEPQMFVQMERHILTTLEWSIGNLFSVNECLNIIFDQSNLFCKGKIPEDQKLFQMTSFLLDLSLYQRDYLTFNSSIRTISALLLASTILNQTIFPDYIKLVVNTNKINPNNESSSTVDEVATGDFLFKFITGNKIDEFTESKLSLDFIIDDNNLNDIRKCLLLYLNDIFKEKLALVNPSVSSNQIEHKYKISKVLFKKYEKLSVKEYLDTFVSKRLELYIHLKNLIEKMETTKRNGCYIQPWLKKSVNMFIDNFASLQEIHYEDEDLLPTTTNHVNTSYHNTVPKAETIGLPTDMNTCASQSLRVQTPIDLNATTPLINRFATAITPLSLRSTSSLSENSLSESTSRNSSIFSQLSFGVESPIYIDATTPMSATLPGIPSLNTNSNNIGGHTKPRSKTINYTSYLHFKNSTLNKHNTTRFSNGGFVKHHLNTSGPPTPSVSKHRYNISFSSAGPSHLFSIDQSPVISSNKRNDVSTDKRSPTKSKDLVSMKNWHLNEDMVDPIDSLPKAYDNTKTQFKQHGKPLHTSINGILDLDQVALQTTE